jgi:hypothetical protein
MCMHKSHDPRRVVLIRQFPYVLLCCTHSVNLVGVTRSMLKILIFFLISKFLNIYCYYFLITSHFMSNPSRKNRPKYNKLFMHHLDFFIDFAKFLGPKRGYFSFLKTKNQAIDHFKTQVKVIHSFFKNNFIRTYRLKSKNLRTN